MENLNIGSKKLENFSPFDRADYLMRSGQKTSALFTQSALLKNDAKAIAIADCLRETYKPENVYIAQDLVNRKTDELFNGYGVLQSVGNSRLSIAYQKFASSRAKERVRRKVDDFKLSHGQRWRFLTLTLPHLKTDVATVLGILNRSLSLFKQRDLWRKNVTGAFFGEEMTIGDASTFYFTHYHLHCHVLLVSGFIEQWKLGDIWTACVEKACREFGVEFLMRNLKSNRLMVDIRDVGRYAKKKGKTMKDSIEELCKYTTKGSDYDKVPVRELLEIDYALRGHQMVKTYGIFNNRKGKSKEKINDKASLDTPHTIQGKAKKVKFKRNERKLESLVKLGETMILEGRRDDWQKFLRLTIQSRREFRRNKLAAQYPHASFATLDGHRWNGVARPPTNY
jgi:hypothetical protein